MWNAVSAHTRSYVHSHTSRACDWVDRSNSDTRVRLHFLPRTQTGSEKPFLALVLPATPETALAASVDRSATLFDLRVGTSVAAAVKYPHPATPAALVFAQSSATQFASGGYDGVVRIWDVRSATREVAIARVWDRKKVLALSWAGEVLAVAGEGGVEVWRAGVGVEGGLQKEMPSNA